MFSWYQFFYLSINMPQNDNLNLYDSSIYFNHQSPEEIGQVKRNLSASQPPSTADIVEEEDGDDEEIEEDGDYQ